MWIPYIWVNQGGADGKNMWVINPAMFWIPSAKEKAPVVPGGLYMYRKTAVTIGAIKCKRTYENQVIQSL